MSSIDSTPSEEKLMIRKLFVCEITRNRCISVCKILTVENEMTLFKPKT